MAGEVDLEKLLALLQPKLLPGLFIFCTVPDMPMAELEKLKPLAMYREKEGLSLLLEQQVADAAGIDYSSIFRGITLSVHSSLEAVGFTAAVANKLASLGISANVIAAHYHDHVFVPADKAEQALSVLTEFQTWRTLG